MMPFARNGPATSLGLHVARDRNPNRAAASWGQGLNGHQRRRGVCSRTRKKKGLREGRGMRRRLRRPGNGLIPFSRDMPEIAWFDVLSSGATLHPKQNMGGSQGEKKKRNIAHIPELAPLLSLQLSHALRSVNKTQIPRWRCPGTRSSPSFAIRSESVET
jgi:hypothetical protein